MIAALFVETGGVYYGLPDVDPWDEARDARLYAGPWPVVAHPPCERWGRYATIGGRLLGDDDGCFESALASVERWGGVLEHPSGSAAWPVYGIQKPCPPELGGWIRARHGWTCQVEQGHYGHRARKATWLYMVGAETRPLFWGRSFAQPIPPRSAFSAILRGVRLSKVGAVAVMSRKQRQRTPPAFRDLLLSIARSCSVQPEPAPAVTGDEKEQG